MNLVEAVWRFSLQFVQWFLSIRPIRQYEEAGNFVVTRESDWLLICRVDVDVDQALSNNSANHSLWPTRYIIQGTLMVVIEDIFSFQHNIGPTLSSITQQLSKMLTDRHEPTYNN